MEKQNPNLERTRIITQIPSFYVSVEILDTIGSTNDFIKDNALTNSEGWVVLAETQTKGKGRNGRIFVSTKGKGLFCSILLKPVNDNRILNKLSLITPLAMAESIFGLYGLRPMIKWPNDLWLNGKKIAGVLIETQFSQDQKTFDYVVVGIGVNVHTQNFPSEIRDIASSLEDFTQIRIDRNELLIKFLNTFKRYLDTSDFVEEYRKWMLPPGTEVIVTHHGVSYFGRVSWLNENGQLVIEKSDGTSVILNSEEIHLSLK